MRAVRNLALGATGAVGALKGLQMLANDDLDDVEYALNKLKARVLSSFGSPSVIQSSGRKPRVVVLGSGWGALSFLQKLDQDKVELTIVSPRSFFFYTPLLAGTATGTVASSSIVEPIRWYCQRSGHGGATFVQAECTSVDVKKKKLKCIVNTDSVGRPFECEYDFLIIAVGAEPVTFGIPGVREHTMFLKEVEDGINIQRRILQSLERASALLKCTSATADVDKEVSKLLSWVIVGGGPTGVELTAELTDFIQQEVREYFPALVPKISLTLMEATDRCLLSFDKTLSAAAEKMLSGRGANVMCNTAVTRIKPDGTIEYKRAGAPGSLVAGTTIWAGGIARRPVVEQIARHIDPYGKVQNSRYGLVVDGHLRVKGVTDNSVFAIGDCAVSGCAPTAQAAYQQGKFLGRLFRDGLEEEPFRYAHRGSLAYTGGGTGVAELKAMLWDNHLSTSTRVEGSGAFALWRSLYFSKLVSSRNQAQVLFDWAKAWVFGRDISTPFIKEKSDK